MKDFKQECGEHRFRHNREEGDRLVGKDPRGSFCDHQDRTGFPWNCQNLATSLITEMSEEAE